MFRKLAMAAIGELRCCASLSSTVLTGSAAQAFLQWMVLSTQPSLRTSPVLWRRWCSLSSGRWSQACARCRRTARETCADALATPAVLSLALLLWHRPYERPLHNIVQAVRANVVHCFCAFTNAHALPRRRSRCSPPGCACWLASRCSTSRRRREQSPRSARCGSPAACAFSCCHLTSSCAGVHRRVAWCLPPSRYGIVLCAPLALP